MEIEEIKMCRICGSPDLIEIIDFGPHALSGIFPKKDELDPIEAPLRLVKCDEEKNNNNCGLLQLKHNVPGELMYKNNYGYRSGINKTMTDHLKGIADEIKSRINLSPNDIILDIGSNDATLLKFFPSDLKKIGIDPAGDQFKSFYTEGMTLISDFFNHENFSKASPYQKAKVITSIAMFYDLKEPMKFINDIRNSLHPEGIWIIEQSYMPLMLEANAFDTICHEHLEYYALKQIKWMMDHAGLRISDVSFNEANGGSFRVTVCHNLSNVSSDHEKINNILNNERKKDLHTKTPYLEFRNRIEQLKVNLKNFISTEKEKGKSIYIYGASTKGNTLLQYLGIGNESITAAAERNPEKYGRRTPKTNIPIISEEEARMQKPDNFLVLPWHFRDEFIEREKDYVDSGGKLIFPLPEFEVIKNEQTNIQESNPEHQKNNLNIQVVEANTQESNQTISEINSTLPDSNPSPQEFNPRTIEIEDTKKTDPVPQEINPLQESTQPAENQKRALITGITGQIGSYLAELLLKKGYDVYGIIRRTSSISSSRERIDHIKGLKQENLIYGDLLDSGSVEKIISEVQPHEIYNLAAQSHVWISFHTPEHTSDTNALGVLRICEAAKRLKHKVKIYQASTSELYGGLHDYPVNEEVQFYPKSPYGIAKLYGYWIMKHYRETYGMFCSNGIVFNSESPRRGENFVTRKITKSVSEIAKGEKDIIYLGNLNARRDWSHAEDSAMAMWLILQAQKPDDFVIASGRTNTVRDFAEAAFKHIGVKIKWRGEGLDEEGYNADTGKTLVKVNPTYFRPSEVNVLIGDSSKAQKELGWKSNYSFEELVGNMMEHELRN